MNTVQPSQINVLIACEESQAETLAFRHLGFNAFSCDIQPCRRGTPAGFHIQGDVTPFLEGRCHFVTQDGTEHAVPGWHLIIAHPPCTFLCKVGSVHLYNPDGTIYWPRLRQMILARRFFLKCLDAQAPYVAVENPIPIKRAQLPPADCYAQPSWFGVKYTKKTLYWLKNLPPILPRLEHPNPKCFVRASRGKYRSRTFPQLAEALATQWGNFVLDELNQQTSVAR